MWEGRGGSSRSAGFATCLLREPEEVSLGKEKEGKPRGALRYTTCGPLLSCYMVLVGPETPFPLFYSI